MILAFIRFTFNSRGRFHHHFLPRIQFYLRYVLCFNVYCSGCVCQPFNKRIMYVCIAHANTTGRCPCKRFETKQMLLKQAYLTDV